MRATSPNTFIPVALTLLASTAGAGIVPPGPDGIPTTTFTFDSGAVAVPILDLQPNPSTIEVQSIGPYLWDVNVTLWATHADTDQLDVRLISPSGTVVVISSDNPFDAPNVFFPASFDDQEAPFLLLFGPSSIPPFAPMAPEGALSSFIGEDPNGTWTLECGDDEAGVQGSFIWEIEVTTLSGASVPLPRQVRYEVPDPQPLGPLSASSEIIIAGVGGGSLIDLEVRVSLEHDAPGDVRLLLTHNAMSTYLAYGGGPAPDFFLNTLFDDDATATVADATAAPIGAVAPAGALGRWNGQDAAGLWSLRIDNAGTEVGTFYGWELILTMADEQPTVIGFCSGFYPAPCPCGNNAALGHGCRGPFNMPGIHAEMRLPNGIARLGDDEVELVVDDLEPFQICLFLQGTQTQSPQPFGDGLLCLDGTLRRLGVRSTGFGSVTFPGPFDRPLWESTGVRPPGATRAYQVVSRSSILFGPCHTGLNTSNGVQTVWLP